MPGPPLVDGEVVDLTNDTAFTLALLEDTWAWRQRLVEVLELRSTEHVLLTSTYQLELLPDLVAPFLDGRTPARAGVCRAKVLLPITTREKGPLLAFAARGPTGSAAHLHLRSQIASVQAEYVQQVVTSSPGRDQLEICLTPDLALAISAASTGGAREYDRIMGDGARRRYLADALDLAISPADLERWRSRTAHVGTVLATALPDEPDPYSTSEDILLALPYLRRPPGSVDEIDALVERYAVGVEEAHRVGDTFLLRLLAEYGRRYEMMIEVDVPLGEPFSVELVEERPVDVRHGRSKFRFNLSDARTGHLQVRSRDTAVRIASFGARSSDGVDVATNTFEGIRRTPELIALYSARADRPYYVDITLRLRVALDVLVPALLVLALAICAAVVAALIPRSDELPAGLGLIVVPTTFAVAVLLAREQTSLASRLLRPLRLALAVAVIALWAVAALRLPW